MDRLNLEVTKNRSLTLGMMLQCNQSSLLKHVCLQIPYEYAYFTDDMRIYTVVQGLQVAHLMLLS